jgi:hypothetical protein
MVKFFEKYFHVNISFMRNALKFGYLEEKINFAQTAEEIL